MITDALSSILLGTTGPRGGHHDGLVQSAARSAARSVGSGLGRAILRGALGSILGGSTSTEAARQSCRESSSLESVSRESSVAGGRSRLSTADSTRDNDSVLSTKDWRLTNSTI